MLDPLIKIENIITDVEVSSKGEIIEKLADLLDENGYIDDGKNFKKDIAKKERLSTTAIGHGVAIPHTKSYYVKESVVGIAILKNGIDYKALDGKDVRIVFMVGMPEDGDNKHIEVLSKISKKLINADFRELLLEATTPRAVATLMKDER